MLPVDAPKMYIESAPLDALKPWIQCRSLWQPTTSGSLWLPADPCCEISWSEVEGEIQGELRFSVSSTQPRRLDYLPSEIGNGSLRIKPEAFEIVRSKLHHGKRFGTGEEVEEWLAKQLVEAPDPRLGAATRMLRKGRAVEEVAYHVGWSVDHFRRRLLRASDVTPGRIQAYARLRRATHLAGKSPNMSLDEIAFRVGMSEASALARSCVRQTGQTFRQFSGNYQMPE